MNVYSVTYDLLKPGQNYDGLINRLRQYGAVRVELSQWIVQTQVDVARLRDDLAQFIDANDRILVAGLTGVAAWRNLIPANESIKKALSA